MTVDTLKQEFDDVLSDTLQPGKMLKGPPMKIHLDPNIPFKPKRVLTARQIPLYWRDEAEKIVKKLLDLGILKRVTEPTSCCSPGHFVPKDGGKAGLRLVTDYSNEHLNKFICRPIHPFPATADILKSILANSKYFCKLDALQGYFQIPLDEESSKLTTFILPSGRYAYTRAPMGLCSSGDEWCQRSDMALQGLNGVVKLVDDILIQAETENELMAKLVQVLERCREYGIQLSLRKMQFGTEVSFAGHIISDTGIRPDPSRIVAIKNFKTPKDTTGLKSFLGLVNQVTRFIPDLAHLTVQIRQLLKKNKVFNWLPEHEAEFQNVKDNLSAHMELKYFDPMLKTELLTDASRLHGLGFALIQHEDDGQIRTGLTDTQSRYATIELECLAIYYGIDKCSFYLKGCPDFTVVTDHRPLVEIMAKSLFEIENSRLQRIRGKIDNYRFKIQWRPGKDHMIADALSRAPYFAANDMLQEDEAEILALVQETTNDASLNFLLEAAKEKNYCNIIAALKEDKNLQELHVNHPARAFSSVWHELSIYSNDSPTLIDFKGNRIVVPVNARQEILRRLHIPHAGFVKTKK